MQHAEPSREYTRNFVMVDAHPYDKTLPTAFAEWGVGTVHVWSALVDSPEGTAAALAPYAPLGVLAGRESGLPLADALSVALGLPGNVEASAPARHDLHRAGEALRCAGLPLGTRIHGDSADAPAAGRGAYPVVVRPSSVTVVDGVRVCRTPQEVHSTAESILRRYERCGGSRTDALVREYLPGPQYTVDTVSCAGQAYVAAVRRRHTGRQGARIVTERTSLLAPDRSPVPALVAYVHRVLAVLGIVQGPARTDLVLTPDGPVLLKAAALLGNGVLPGYDDVCLGANQADLTALAYAAPKEFLDRWAGRGYDKLCEAQVIATGSPPPTAGGQPAPAVADAIEVLPSVYFFDSGLRLGGSVRNTADGCTGLAYVLNGSADRMAQDVRRIRELTAPDPRPVPASLGKAVHAG
jgi:hypothetical protein